MTNYGYNFKYTKKRFEQKNDKINIDCRNLGHSSR